MTYHQKLIAAKGFPAMTFTRPHVCHPLPLAAAGTLAHPVKNASAEPPPESQCLAVAADNTLRTWKKRPQPVIPTPPPGMKVTGFRDPSPFQLNDTQYLLVASGEPRKGGMLLLYRAAKSSPGTNDLTHWE